MEQKETQKLENAKQNKAFYMSEDLNLQGCKTI